MPIYDRSWPAAPLPAVDRILLDLGLSSDQLADNARGFSFSSDGPLDLRFLTQVVENRLPISSRGWMNRSWGKSSSSLEKNGTARRIARNIVASASHNPIRTACDLAEAVAGTGQQPRSARQESRDTAGTPPGHAHFSGTADRRQSGIGASSNRPLAGVLYDCLRPGGYVVFIRCFQPLEDRPVNTPFENQNQWQTPDPQAAIMASPVEQRCQNSTLSASAWLRAARKRPAETPT